MGLLLLVATLVRGGYTLSLRDEPRHHVPALEPGFNYAWAEAAATGEWDRHRPGTRSVSSIASTPYVQPPGYPSFVAGLFRVAGVHRFLPLGVQQAMGVWVVWLVWWSARRWVSPRAGWFAGVLAALHWSLVYYGAEFLDAGILTTLVTAAFVALGLLGERTVRRLAGERSRRTGILAVAAGVALGMATVVRPAAWPLLPLALVWLLWIAWRARNPSLRAAAVALLSRDLPPTCHVDEDSDVLLASMEPSGGVRLAAALRGVPAALALAAPALIGLLVGAALAVAPVAWRNWRVSGHVVPVCVGQPIAALVGALPDSGGFDDGDVGAGSRLDRVADYGHLAIVAGSDDPGVIRQHFVRQCASLWQQQPGATALGLAQRLKLFWGPLDVGSSRVVEYDRVASPWLRALPVPFSLLNALALLGLAFWTVPRPGEANRSRVPGADAKVPVVVVRGLPLLVLAVLLAWTGAHLPFLASGLWRQPVLPLLAFLAAWAFEDLCASLAARRPREAVFWLLTVVCCWMATAQNFGRYVPNRAKWLLDCGLALDAVGLNDAAQTAYQTVLMATPGIVDPATDAQTAKSDLSERDTLRFQRAAAVACVKLGNRKAAAEERDLALQYFRLASTLEPRRSEALINAGTLLLAGGRIPEAIEALEEALRRDPRAFPARYPLAQSLYRMGRYDEACRQLDTVLAAVPGHEAARNLRALIRAEP